MIRQCEYVSGTWRCSGRKAKTDDHFCDAHLGGRINDRRYGIRGCGCKRGSGWVFCPFCGQKLPPKESVSPKVLRSENEALKAEISELRAAALAAKGVEPV